MVLEVGVALQLSYDQSVFDRRFAAGSSRETEIIAVLFPDLQSRHLVGNLSYRLLPLILQ